MFREYLSCEFGIFEINSDEGALTGVRRVYEKGAEVPGEITHRAAEELEEYFLARRRSIELPLRLGGSEFQRRIWNAMAKIPYGETASYSELCRMAGVDGAWRAAGNAVGRNPFLIILPCHRVVGVHGVGGFSAGLDLKLKLLKFEAQHR